MESFATKWRWFHHSKCGESAQDPLPSLPFQCDAAQSHHGYKGTTAVGGASSADGHATIQCSVDAWGWS